jgi:hypothetical protein
LSDNDVRRLVNFVKDGGRLLVLDDSARYSPVLDGVIEVALGLAKAGIEAPDAEPIDAAFVERVTDLVKALGSLNFRTREDATAELLKLGMRGLELAEKMPSDDPEIAARIALVRRKLNPAGGVITNEYRRKKQGATAKRVAAAAAMLKDAGFPYRIDTVYADSEGAPLPTLIVALPTK